MMADLEMGLELEQNMAPPQIPEIQGVTELGTVPEVEASLLEAQLIVLGVPIVIEAGDTVPEVGVHTGPAFPLKVILQSPLELRAAALLVMVTPLTVPEVVIMAIPLAPVDYLSGLESECLADQAATCGPVLHSL
uniref:Uncharacterized protein n=1 Tax=Sphaerodactylus townsendi TaxID=933632 RepID=A0ACB8EM41_9SAUR